MDLGPRPSRRLERGCVKLSSSAMRSSLWRARRRSGVERLLVKEGILILDLSVGFDRVETRQRVSTVKESPDLVGCKATPALATTKWDLS